MPSAHQCAGERYQLLLATRELERAARRHALHLGQDAIDEAESLRYGWIAVCPSWQEHVLLDSEFRHEAAILRHVADAEARTRVRRSRAQVFIKKFHLAGADSQESHDRTHERRLTGAIAADEPDERARRNRQNDIRQHRQACDLDRKVSNVEGPAHARTPSARRCNSAPTT